MEVLIFKTKSKSSTFSAQKVDQSVLIVKYSFIKMGIIFYFLIVGAGLVTAFLMNKILKAIKLI